MSKKSLKEYAFINYVTDCSIIRSYFTLAMSVALPANYRHPRTMPSSTHNDIYDPIYQTMLREFERYCNGLSQHPPVKDSVDVALSLFVNYRKYNNKNKGGKVYSLEDLSFRINSNKKLGKRRLMLKKILKAYYVHQQTNDKRRVADKQKICLKYPASRVPIIFHSNVRDYLIQ